MELASLGDRRELASLQYYIISLLLLLFVLDFPTQKRNYMYNIM